MEQKGSDIFSKLKPEARKIVTEICARAILRKHKQAIAENEKSGKQNAVGQ